MTHRHKSATAFLCFLLCVPLAFIAYFAVVYYTESIYAGEITSVEITAPQGAAKTYTDRESIDFYLGLLKNAKPLSAPVGPAEESAAVTASYLSEGVSKTYKIYPELSLTGCMLADNLGKFFLINGEDARTLLSKEEFAYLYSETFLPAMYAVSGGLQNEVTPSGYEWRYKKIDGVYADYRGTPVLDAGEETPLFSMYSDRENSIRFTRPPDDLDVVITDEDGNLIGQSVFDGLIFGRDTRLSVTVEAVWNLKGGSTCDGKASYSFDILYDIPAELEFESDSAEIGGFVKINVKHLNEGETVVFHSSLVMGDLHFTENAGVKTGIMGISDINLPGEYELDYTIGDNSGSKTLALTGAPREDTSMVYRLGLPRDDYDALLGEKAREEIAEIQKKKAFPAENTTFAQIDDLLPPVSGISPAVEYGTKIIVNIGDDAKTEIFYSPGDIYEVVANSKVSAAADGKIIFAGPTRTLGNLIIVDHGCGVTTWYFGFSFIEKSVGTLVQKSSPLGFVGKNPYTGTSSAGFCVNAGGIFIKPPQNS